MREHDLARHSTAAHGACPDADQLARLAAGDLPEAERLRLVDHLASCDDCAEEYRAAAALGPWAAQAAVAMRDAEPRPRPQPARPALLAGLAVAAAVACLAIGAWLVWQLGAAGRRAPLSVESPAPPLAPPDPPSATPGPPEGQVQAPTQTPAPRPPAPRAIPPVFAVLLSPAMTRGAAPEVIRVPAGALRVLFRVPVAEGESYRAYRLTLRDEDDRVVARAEAVKPTRARELELLAEAASLPERAELHVEGLDGAGQATDLAYLPLDIRR